MHTTSRTGHWTIRLAALIVSTATAGCGIEKQSAPALAGPSELATSITLSASPDTLPRDGESQSVIIVSARDPQNNPAPRLMLTLFANAGVLSMQQVEVVNGQATFIYTAPSLQEAVSTAVISAVPVGTNIDNAVSRSVSIALLAPASATASFTITPANLVAFQLATLDASATTLSGAACGSACTYEWTFGAEATATGQTVTYRFQQEGVYVVTLTITSPGGVKTQRQQVVTVGPAVTPTATFTFSPTDPRPGDTVRFNGTSSTGANGATIESYAWDFGNGLTGTGPTPETTFAAGLERTYLVRLTVTDNRGKTATVTQQIQVAF